MSGIATWVAIIGSIVIGVLCLRWDPNGLPSRGSTRGTILVGAWWLFVYLIDAFWLRGR